MEMIPKRPVAVVGRVTRVEQCPCGGALVVVVGPVSLRLDVASARDVAATLTQVLTLICAAADDDAGAGN